MCGIAGFAGNGSWRSDPSARLRAMCDVIAHRGPDDAGYLDGDEVSLGMRRLSIIDLGGGHQPISNEDGTVTVVFNGEIYNYRELTRELLKAGHRFATHSDTETLVHLYEDHGLDMLRHLRGMFAFALWDARRRRLLIARDRLGIKPLHYRLLPEGIAFASELKSLVTMDPGADAIDRRAVAQFLALGYVPDPGCVIEGVQKLPPGHLLTWERPTGAAVRQYWAPPVEEDPTIDQEGAVTEIRRLLSEAVRYRLVADVPVGAFLSGGLDSSAVVAEMARQMDRPVQTFSIGFREAAFNEAPDAAAVAAALGTEHREWIVNPEIDALIDWLGTAFDEPFADSSALPTLLVSKLAARHLKVVLSGDGGDELFGGYTRYLPAARSARTLPAAVRRLLAAGALRLPQGARGRNRLLALSRDHVGQYLTTVADPLLPKYGGVARPDTAAAAGKWEALLDPWFDRSMGRGAASLLHVDMLTYLPGDILTKVDRMSMAVSLEARVPLLDHHLVEFACRIPISLKIRDGRGKLVFRQAVRDLVPPHVLQKRKQGFSLPLAAWFRNELRPRIELLRLEGQPIAQYVDPSAVGRIIYEHLQGRRDHSPMLWKLLMLNTWLRRRSSLAAPAPLEAVFAA